MAGQPGLGEAFARALAGKDFDAVAGLMDPAIDFRAMTPRRTWEAADPQTAVASILREWFGEDDTIEELQRLECDAFADRERVGYRFLVSNGEGRFLVEQQAYLSARAGRIAWMRVLCSGYRPQD